MSEEIPLEALIAATAAGDKAAFAALYRRTAAKLYGVIVRILPQGGRAEDALQDVYTRIWHAAGSFDPRRGRPVTWLAAIARNRAVDLLRQDGSRIEGRLVDIDPEMLGAIVDDRPGADEVAELRRCLDTLDPQHRECILLAYVEGASREELGERFGRPTGTIKSWLSRGLASLRGCLTHG
jgi:RNA polymerase sigma-70 factor (ECF subfamily)